MSGRPPFAVRRPVLVLVGWVLLILAAVPLAQTLDDKLATATIEAPDSESAAARRALAEDFPGAYRYEVVLTAQGADRDRCAAVADAVGGYTGAHVLGVDQPRAGDCFVRAGTSSRPNDLVEILRADRTGLEALAGGPVLVGGAPGISADIGHVSKENVAAVEKLALPVVFLLLLLVFRSPLTAVIPLVTGGAAIVLSSGVLALLARVVDLSPLTMNVVTMLGLGVSIDYALFVTRRFRQERAAGTDVVAALAQTGATTGRAVAWAGLTVAASLAVLMISDSLVTTSVAVGGAVVVLLSVLLSWTLLPAILRLVGGWIGRRPVAAVTGTRSIRYAALVTRHPGLALVLGAALLLLLAVPAVRLDMHLPAAAFDELPVGTESRVATEQLVEAYGEGAVFPVTLLARTDGPVTAAENRARLAAAVEQVARLDGVAAVLAPALLDPPTPGSVSTDGTATVVRLVTQSAASSEQTRELVTALRAQELDGISLQVTGETATGMDVDDQVGGSLPLALALLAVVTLGLLFAAFRSVVIPVKAVLCNALVTLATVGLLVGVFQLEWFSLVEPAPINVNTPIVMFALLFGLSTDYEVIIVGRIRERWAAGRPMVDAVREGLASTAGMVNGAASIMVVVFAAFLLSDFRIVQELGFGLAVAVLLDVLVVRSLLVPAALVLIGDRSFWPSRQPSSDPVPASHPAEPGGGRGLVASTSGS